MKKLIFSILLMLSMALVSYGKPANKNNGLMKGLSTALKTSGSVSTITTAQYKKTSFYFNGKTVSAYYDAESEELIGFSIPMSVNDLPQGATDNIKNKFDKYAIDSLIMFIDKEGFFGIYVSLSRPEVPNIVISINAKGKAHYFKKM